ncbi:hypothetical protein JCM11641_003588 [Rhodosporidiobolus odoratus]
MATASPANLDGPFHLDLDASLNSAPTLPSSPLTDRVNAARPSRSPKKALARTLQPKELETASIEQDGDGLLVDVGQDEDTLRATAPSTALRPPISSHLALSLLDKSPSLLKAHLKTPLVPLGSPITARKTRRTASKQQENSPSVRFDNKRSFSSPSPATYDAPSDSPASPPTGPVRFSPSASPRLRSSLRKARHASTPLSTNTPSHPQPPIHPRLASLATPLHRVGSHPLASPFHFSPYTPPIRTHASYRDDELTDCDADFSLYDENEEDERSFSDPRDDVPSVTAAMPEQDDDAIEELVKAVLPLSLAEKDETSAEAQEDAAETSVELAETEVATSDEEEAAPELQAIEEDEQQPSTMHPEEEREEHLVSTSDEEGRPSGCPQALDRGEAPLQGTTDGPMNGPKPEAEDEEQVDGMTPTASLPVDVAEAVGDHAEAQTAAGPEDPAAKLVEEAIPLALSLQCTSDEALPAEQLKDAAIQPVDSEVEDVREEDQAAASTSDASSVQRSPTPPSPFLTTSPLIVPVLSSRAESTSSRDVAPSTPRHLARTFSTLPLQPAPTSETPISSRLAPVPETPPPSESLSHSAAARAPRATTPSAAKRVVPPSTAAPTAQRQLTKLTSLAAQRAPATVPPPSATRAALTSLVPGSAAPSARRIVAPVKSGLPKPSGLPSSIARRPGGLASVQEVATPGPDIESQAKRPASSLSTSSLSSASAASSASSNVAAPPTTAARSRPAPVKSGLKPPSTTPGSTAIPRTLASAASSAQTAAPSTTTAKPPTLSSTRPTRSAGTAAARPVPSISSAPTPSSRLARTASAVESSSLRPPIGGTTVPRAPSPLQQTTSAPALSTTRGLSSSVPPANSTLRPGRTPRAALAAVASAKPAVVAASRSAAAPGPSPGKRRAARLVGGKIEVSKVLEPPAAELQPLVPSPPSPRSASPDATNPPPAPHAAVFSSSQQSAVSRSASPPRTTRPPASPTRSPRRVLVSMQQPSTSLSASSASSALSAPADKLTTAFASVEVFGSTALKPAPPLRATRSRRTQPSSSESAVLPAPIRTTRRAAAAASAAPSIPAPPAKPPAPVERIVRSARRPAPKAVEPVEQPLPELESDETASESSLSTPSTAEEPSLHPATRPQPIFRPFPDITGPDYVKLVKRNTVKNQKLFVKLKEETVYLDYNRPPSPTSKIRRSTDSEGGAGRPSTKEGREARAAKRRNALRSSVDGSEMDALAAEMQDSESGGAGGKVQSASLPPMEHFRAPGDDEQFVTPMRVPALKAVAKGGKRKGSTGSSVPGTPVAEVRRVKWDRALVYEGPRPEQVRPSADGIIKPSELDEWGNTVASTASLGRPSPVTIIRRVFKDDQEE